MVDDQSTNLVSVENLIHDYRLSRLFSQKGPCALQLWILQIGSAELMENRFLYGRLAPYRYANHKWSFSQNNRSAIIGTYKTKVVRLNLYLAACRT